MKANKNDEPTATGKTSSFSTIYNEDAEGTHFSTIATKAWPKPAGKGLLGGISGFIAIVVIGFATSAKGEVSGFSLLMAAVFGVGIAWILLHTRLNDERVAAADTHFFIGRLGVKTLYPQASKVALDAIDLLRMRNTMTDAVIVSRQFIGTPTLSAAVGHAGTAMHNQIAKLEGEYLQHLADNSFVVEVQSCGKTTILAGGLDELTASGLMAAVSRAIAKA